MKTLLHLTLVSALALIPLNLQAEDNKPAPEPKKEAKISCQLNFKENKKGRKMKWIIKINSIEAVK